MQSVNNNFASLHNMVYFFHSSAIRDWSLIRGGGGGLQNGRGGGMRSFTPKKKGGRGEAQQVLSMLKGGHTKFWGSFYMVV